MNSNLFNRDELLDEHRILRTRYEEEIKSFMSNEYDTMNKAIQSAILDAIMGIDTKSEDDKMELSFYIARKIHLADSKI